MEIANKRIVITGGASGLGFAAAEFLQNSNAKVAIIDFSEENLKAIDDKYIKFSCDVSNFDQVKTTIDKVNEALGGIDILINSAGQMHSEPIINIMSRGDKKHSLDNWNRIINNNLNSVFYVTSNVLEKMIASRIKGLIINISSISANGNAGQAAYSSAKAGVESFTKVIAKELGGLGIRAVAIAPGFIDTPSTKKALSEDKINDITRRVPLRKLGNVEHIVSSIEFIIKNDYVTGTVMNIDGGLVI